MTDPDLPEHVKRNRDLWDRWAKDYAQVGARAWAGAEQSRGIWSVPESDLHVLPADLAGSDAIELGCGTAYVSCWLARRGARVVAIDNSEAQLTTARRYQQEHALYFPLLPGNAEQVPYPDASFDLVISEYGACLWADPYRWIPEAGRLLRPGGELIFLTNAALLTLCVPEADEAAATDRLLRPAFGMYRVEWPGDHGVEFHLSHGDWIRLSASGDAMRTPTARTSHRRRYRARRSLEKADQIASLLGVELRPGDTELLRTDTGPSRRVCLIVREGCR